jgi:hypothetical protein
MAALALRARPARRSTQSLDCTVDPLPHIKQDPEYADLGATLWLWIACACLVGVAAIAYELDHRTMALIFVSLGVVGLSVTRVPYSKLLARFRTKETSGEGN